MPITNGSCCNVYHGVNDLQIEETNLFSGIRWKTKSDKFLWALSCGSEFMCLYSGIHISCDILSFLTNSNLTFE